MHHRHRRPHIHLAMLGCVVLLSHTPRLCAQSDPQQDAQHENDAPTFDDPFAHVSFSATPKLLVATEEDLDTTGTVSILRIGPDIRIRYAPEKTAFFDVHVGGEFSFYDFANATNIVSSGDPAGDTSRTWIGAAYTAQIDDKWWMFASGKALWAFESGASVGDAFIGTGTIGASYAFNDTLTIGLGVYARSRLEDNAQVFPIPYINWAINDQWSLASTQTGARLSYVLDEDWTLFFDGSWESREYRLDDNGPIPGGVMRDDRIPLTLGAIWKAGDHVSLEASAGLNAATQYEFLDAAGNTIADVDGDGSVRIGFNASVHF